MNLSHAGFPSLLAVSFLGGSVPAIAQAQPDFCDATGITPEQFAADLSGSRLLFSPTYQLDEQRLLLKQLILSPAHRTTLLAELEKSAASGDLIPSLCLATLLEEDGKPAEALATLHRIPQGARGNLPQLPYEEIRLLWKSGRTAEAAEQTPLSSEGGFAFSIFEPAAKTDAANLPAFLKFLDALEARAVSLGLKASIVRQRYEIAKRQDGVDALIANTDSPALKAAWYAMAQRDDEAARLLNSAFSAADTALLLKLCGPVPVLLEQARAVLNQNPLPLEDRRALLTALFASDNALATACWLKMPTGHNETVGTIPRNSFNDQETNSRLLKLAESMPDAPSVNLLAASNLPNSARNPELQARLMERAAKAPLVAGFPEQREWTPDYAGDVEDPTGRALAFLGANGRAQQAHDLLHASPDFASLPPEARLRYLAFATLDREFTDLAEKIDFTSPRNDSLGKRVIAYYQRRATDTTIPPEIPERLAALAPNLICGSPEKGAGPIINDLSTALSLLRALKADKERLTNVLTRFDQILQTRGEVRTQVLRASSHFLSDQPAAAFLVEAAKLLPPDPGKKADEMSLATVLFGVFAPPSEMKSMMSRWPTAGRFQQRDRSNPESGQLFGGRNPRNPGDAERANSNGYSLNLAALEMSQLFPGSRDPNTPESQKPAALLAALRKRFADDDPRTMAYDLVVTAKLYPCPDPEVFQRATEAAARWRAMPVEPWGTFQPSFLSARVAKRQPLPEPPPLSQQERLDRISEKGIENTEESYTLCSEILTGIIDRGNNLEMPGYKALQILVGNGRFDAFLKDLDKHLEARGGDEVAKLNARLTFYGYDAVFSGNESLDTARKILALDPRHKTANTVILMREGNTLNDAEFDTCLTALWPHQSSLLLQGISRRIAVAGQNGREKEVAERFVSKLETLKPVEAEAPALNDLVETLAQPYPELSIRLTAWATGNTAPDPATAIRQAVALKKIGRGEEGVDLIVRSLFPAEKARKDSSSLQFLPRKETEAVFSPKRGAPFDPSLLRELNASGLLDAVLTKTSGMELGSQARQRRWAIAIIADPSVDTWKRLEPEILRDLKPEEYGLFQGALFQQLGYGSTPVKLAIDKALNRFDGRENLSSQLSASIKLAGDNLDTPRVNELWKRSVPMPRGETVRIEESNKVYFLAAITGSLMEAASDATWESYLEEIDRVKFSGVDGNQQMQLPFLASTIAGKRYAQLVKREFDKPEQKPMDPSKLERFAIAAAMGVLAPEQRDIVADRIREATAKFPEKSGRPGLLKRWSDLSSGDFSAAIPAIFVEPAEKDGLTVYWSVFGTPDTLALLPCPPREQPAFQVQVFAGPRQDQLSPVGEISGGPIGSTRVTLPEDARWVNATITGGDKTVRWTKAVKVPGAVSTLSVLDLPESPFRIKDETPVPGPFGNESAVTFRLPPQSTLSLATLPLTAGISVYGGLWTLSVDGSASIAVIPKDVSGKPIPNRTTILESMTVSGGFPLWQPALFGDSGRIPPDTASIELVAQNTSPSPATFRLTPIHAGKGAAPKIPDGLALKSETRGSIRKISTGPDADTLILQGEKGIAFFDTKNPASVEWLKLPENSPEAPFPDTEGTFHFIAGKIFLETHGYNGGLYEIDRGAAGIRKLTDLGQRRELIFSKDGTFVAWAGASIDAHLARIDNGTFKEIRYLECGRVDSLAFNPDKKTLEAIVDGRWIRLPLDRPDAELENSARPNPLPDYFRRNRPMPAVLPEETGIRLTNGYPGSGEGEPLVRVHAASKRIEVRGVFLKTSEDSAWMADGAGNLYQLDLKKLLESGDTPKR